MAGNRVVSGQNAVLYTNYDTDTNSSSTFDLRVLCNDFSKITGSSFLLQDGPNRMRQSWFTANKLGGGGNGHINLGVPVNPAVKPTNWLQGNQFWWNGSSPLVLGITPNTPTVSATNCTVGMRFTVGNLDIVASCLGRWVLPGNSNSHMLYLTDLSGSVLASTTVSTVNQTPGAFACAELPNVVVLAANTSYYLLSSETASGDNWCLNCPVTAISGATVNGSVYGSVFTPGAQCNGPINFTSCMLANRIGTSWTTNGSGSTNLGINASNQYKINNPSEFDNSRFLLY